MNRKRLKQSGTELLGQKATINSVTSMNFNLKNILVNCFMLYHYYVIVLCSSSEGAIFTMIYRITLKLGFGKKKN